MALENFYDTLNRMRQQGNLTSANPAFNNNRWYAVTKAALDAERAENSRLAELARQRKVDNMNKKLIQAQLDQAKTNEKANAIKGVLEGAKTIKELYGYGKKAYDAYNKPSEGATNTGAGLSSAEFDPTQPVQPREMKLDYNDINLASRYTPVNTNLSTPEMGSSLSGRMSPDRLNLGNYSSELGTTTGAELQPTRFTLNPDVGAIKQYDVGGLRQNVAEVKGEDGQSQTVTQAQAPTTSSFYGDTMGYNALRNATNVLTNAPSFGSNAVGHINPDRFNLGNYGDQLNQSNAPVGNNATGGGGFSLGYGDLMSAGTSAYAASQGNYGPALSTVGNLAGRALGSSTPYGAIAQSLYGAYRGTQNNTEQPQMTEGMRMFSGFNRNESGDAANALEGSASAGPNTQYIHAADTNLANKDYGEAWRNVGAFSRSPDWSTSWIDNSGWFD